MDLGQLKQILDLVREHELSEFEVEHDGLRLKIRKDAVVVSGVAAVAPGTPVQSAPSAPAGGPIPAIPAAGGSPAAAPSEEAEVELAVVKSPIVGTFYRAPEPGAANFVEIGSKVKKGDVLCIIEAMKLMNEIDSEYDGEIVSVYVENGQPVQYGERLVAIRTK
ncbi:MAG: acetyl-CoA carboxylase biotin carboxyl carrier protein [Acidobacteria bacterium]|nr:acetyl-CoA carboxylase biotin carboxyl carrier protein [Acidobacteriota bacterium]